MGRVPGLPAGNVLFSAKVLLAKVSRTGMRVRFYERPSGGCSLGLRNGRNALTCAPVAYAGQQRSL